MSGTSSPFLTLIIKPLRPFEKSVNVYQSTRRNAQEYFNFYQDLYETRISRMLSSCQIFISGLKA
jgi:hypothetical protein